MQPNQIESIVLTTIQEVSVTPGLRLTRDTNLESETGLDSLSRLEILALLEERCRVVLPAAKLRDCRTVQQIALAVFEAQDSERKSRVA